MSSLKNPKKLKNQSQNPTTLDISSLPLWWLSKIAGHIALNISPHGVMLTNPSVDHIIKSTSQRLRSIYSKHKCYPNSVIKTWSSTQPGFILYTSQFLKNIKVVPYTGLNMTKEQLDKLLAVGSIIKVSNGAYYEGYEGYRMANEEYENEEVRNLAVITLSRCKDLKVFPLWGESTKIIKIGNYARILDAEPWYQSLESAVNGLSLFSVVQDKSFGLELYKKFALKPIYADKKAFHYRKWNPDMITGGYCLIIEPTLGTTDNFLIRRFELHKLPIKRVGNYLQLCIKFGTQRIVATYKCDTSISYENAAKIIGVTTVNPSMDELTLWNKLMYYGVFDIDSRFDITKTTNNTKVTVSFVKTSNNFSSSNVLTLLSKSWLTVDMGKERMVVVGEKGSMKECLIRILDKVYDKEKFICINSDCYGCWITWKLTSKEGDNFDFANRSTITSDDSYFNILAEQFLKDRKIKNPVKLTDKEWVLHRDAFNMLLVSKWHDPIYGIRPFQIALEQQLGKRQILYFVHTEKEATLMYPIPALLKLYMPNNKQQVMAKRDKSSIYKVETFLQQIYEEMINPSLPTLHPGELLMLLNVDVTLSKSAFDDPKRVEQMNDENTTKSKVPVEEPVEFVINAGAATTSS